MEREARHADAGPAKAICHSAVHHLCLQDDDMFSPKYSGGHGFGGGMPYGAMPLPGRPAAVPHPATLAGTSAYQQVGLWRVMQQPSCILCSAAAATFNVGPGGGPAVPRPLGRSVEMCTVRWHV